MISLINNLDLNPLFLATILSAVILTDVAVGARPACLTAAFVWLDTNAMDTFLGADGLASIIGWHWGVARAAYVYCSGFGLTLLAK